MIQRDKNAILEQNEIDAIKINQEIIKRMAENSQRIKNFFLAMCAIVSALIGKQQIQMSGYILLVFIAVTTVFWFMDAKYLQLERQFRKHHMSIVSGSIGFLEQWDFNPHRYRKDSTLNLMISFSLLIYPTAITLGCCVFFALVIFPRVGTHLQSILQYF